MADTTTMTTLAETENYTAWQATEPDGEVTIHVEMGSITLHFFPEEWEEFTALIDDVLASRGNKGKGRK